MLLVAIYKCFASGAVLFANAVAASALPQRADIPPIAIRAVPTPPGFNMLVTTI